MKTVVTGGAGFIGSHIAENLLQKGHDVHIVDNFLTGNKSNLRPLERYSGFTFHEQSITELDPLCAIFDGADTVFHEAALPSVPRSVANPLATHLHCVTGTLNVLEAARLAGVRRVVYASSSSVYGDIEADWKVETMAPAPKSPYGVAKLSAEYYCRTFYDSYGLETVALRYFNVFGPGQDPNSPYSAVIPKFVAQMLSGNPPIIYGDGMQSRDFTYIDNVVHGNLLAAQSPDAAGQAINLALGERITLNDLVNKLNKILGTEFEPIYTGERSGDIKHSRANIGKARSLLGYDPVVDFDTGLARTVAWYRHYFQDHQLPQSN